MAAKPDSQDLCFVPRGDYRAFLRERAPDAMVPGRIVDHDGRELGRHDGAAGFTVGQRRGLPAVGTPRYVRSVEPRDGHRTRRAARGRADVPRARRGRALDRRSSRPRREPSSGSHARIRHASRPRPARLEVAAGDAARVEVVFDEPAFAPAPGQALVAYVGDAVLCGGTLGAHHEPGRGRKVEPNGR